MDITMHFSQWNLKLQNKPADLIFSWERSFNEKQYYLDTFELALGYIYGLFLLRPRTATIDVSINTINYKQTEFLQLLNVREHFLASRVHPPRITDTLIQYLTRIKRQVTMEYVIVITPNPDDEHHVQVIQFNNLSFLQGFISVLRGFNEGTIDYIVTIYGRNGIEYTIR